MTDDMHDITEAIAGMGLGTATTITPLGGGVSCDVHAVQTGTGTIVVKRALPKLRVKADWRAPPERAASEVGWLRLVRAIDPHWVPAVLAEDRARHMFAMEFLPPENHPVWKAELAAGRVDVAFAAKVGTALAAIHAATAGRADIAAAFDNGALFHALRLEPYLLFTAERHPFVAQAIRDEAGDAAVWLDEQTGPLAPRNIYGVTKLAAEGLCRLYAAEHGMGCVVLRTGRFFPEDDDTHAQPAGENLKANEMLHRRLTVEDAAEAHVVALERAPEIGFDVFVLSAPTPFCREEAGELKRDAAAVIARHFPDATELYARRGWQLPASIGRVYDAGHAERRLGWRGRTGFGEVLAGLREGGELPIVNDAGYVSPKERGELAGG